MHLQKRLEEIIVEKYYVADQKRRRTQCWKIKSRICHLQNFCKNVARLSFSAAYGVPGHPFVLKTSTYFFNTNTETATANEIQSKDLNKGALMLDSWLSVAASADKYMAVLKSSDTTKLF